MKICNETQNVSPFCYQHVYFKIFIVDAKMQINATVIKGLSVIIKPGLEFSFAAAKIMLGW